MAPPVVGLDALAHRLSLGVDPASLAPAFLHRSWCAENPGHDSNERLEFLGDAVLGMVVTDHIFRAFAAVDEGVLTEIRKTVVSSVALAEVATELGLGECLLLGRGEELSGGREKPSILADALEALIGITYLLLGYEAAYDLVIGLVGDRLATASTDGHDHKSRLQEMAAQRFATAPVYEVDASGPDHARTFQVTVSMVGVPYGEGQGRSKKQAEQAAARAALAALVGADDPSRPVAGPVPGASVRGVLSDEKEPSGG